MGLMYPRAASSVAARSVAAREKERDGLFVSKRVGAHTRWGADERRGTTVAAARRAPLPLGACIARELDWRPLLGVVGWARR